MFLRDYRREHAITLDAIAQEGRELGATWSLSSVQAIEGGRAAPTLPTLLTLALVLGRLSGEPLRLADMFGAVQVLDRPYVVTPDQPVRRSWLQRVLSGLPVELLDADYEHARAVRISVEDEELERAVWERGPGPLTAEERRGHFEAMWEAAIEPPEPEVLRNRGPRSSASLAESRAAKKLGIRPFELQQRAIQMWGRPLEDEALSRAGSESTPQARGRITRVLVDEMREFLAEER